MLNDFQLNVSNIIVIFDFVPDLDFFDFEHLHFLLFCLNSAISVKSCWSETLATAFPAKISFLKLKLC